MTVLTSPACKRRYELAEGPAWDPVGKQVVWVDIDAGQVLRGQLVDDLVEVATITSVDHTVGAAVPAADGGMLVVARDHLATIDADGTVRHSLSIIDGGPTRRFNDAACDPRGRLLVGTLSLDGSKGRECLLTVQGPEVRRLLTGLTISNGLGWSPDGARLYHVDSDPGILRAHDYNLATGSLGPSRVIVDVSDVDPPASRRGHLGAGVPDGLCVDAEGCLWVAYWGAGEVRRLSPVGELLEVRELPAPNTSSCAFVGPDLDRLLVTSARADLSDAERAQWPDSGAMFVLPVDVPGLPRGLWPGSTTTAPATINVRQQKQERSCN